MILAEGEQLCIIPKIIKEKESGSVEIKMNRYLAMEFYHIKDIGDDFTFMAIAIVVWLCQ